MLGRFGASQKMYIQLFGEPGMNEMLQIMTLVGKVKRLIIELPLASE